MDNPSPTLGGIEAGGTKFVCAVARAPDDILMETRIPTRSPEETVPEVAAFFGEAAAKFGPLRALGIGTFGPADLDPRSPGYGGILKTPKAEWAGFNLVNSLRDAMGTPVPIAFDTDVNAAAVGEAEHGAGKHLRHIAYVTVGTGIGAGLLLDGNPVHGRMHPEVGHLSVPDLDAGFDRDTNVCPFHASCLEGRACGPAIEERWGAPGPELGEDHPAWDLEARYLAHGAVDLSAAWSPEVILFGGGVMQQRGLIDRVRRAFESLAGGYWALPPLDLYLRTPELGQKAGIVGALSLARRLL